MEFEKMFPTVVREDGEDYDIDDVDDPGSDDNNELSGEEELLKALRDLNKEEDEEEDDDEDEDEDESEDDETDDEDEDEDASDEDKVDEQPKKQSKEDNAKFAAQRRQQEVEKRIQAEMEKFRNESPELALAKQLSELYGKDAGQIMADIKEAQLQEEAKQRNLPIELLRERQADRDRLQSVEAELNNLRFQSWQSKIKADSENLKSQYGMLTDEDFDGAVDYILNTVRNVDLPLEQAIFALHGKKIVDGLAKAKTQDKLAEESGRKKKTVLAPNNSKPKKSNGLTQEERYVAKQMGLSEEEYLKYK